MSNLGTRLPTHRACLIRDRRVRYCRCVRWVIAWDGTRLVIVQRVRMAWFGPVAATALGVGLLVAAGWDAAVPGVLLLVLAAALVSFEVWGYRRIEADERIVRAGRWSVAAAQVQVLTLRREIRFVTTWWGRGDLRFDTLFVGLVGGRSIDLVTIDGDVLDGRPGQRLAAALAALPYGRLPRRPPSRP